MYSGAADWGEGALAEAHRAIPVLEEHDDQAGLAKAWRVIGAVHGVACRYGEAAPAVQRAIEHARAAGDVRQERRNAAAYALAALYGPTPVPEAIASCERIVEESAGDRRSEGLALSALAQLEAMRGDFDLARKRVGRARDMLTELGGSVLAASTSIDAAEVELLAGDPVAAEAAAARRPADARGDGRRLPALDRLLRCSPRPCASRAASTRPRRRWP